MNYLFVPVIIVLACGGSIGMIKGIQKLFPNSKNITDRTNDWIERHREK